jgi:hypothetical protein
MNFEVEYDSIANTCNEVVVGTRKWFLDLVVKLGVNVILDSAIEFGFKIQFESIHSKFDGMFVFVSPKSNSQIIAGKKPIYESVLFLGEEFTCVPSLDYECPKKFYTMETLFEEMIRLNNLSKTKYEENIIRVNTDDDVDDVDNVYICCEPKNVNFED